jgi:hypothetical protein
MFVETSNEVLGLVELPDCIFGILPDLLLVIVYILNEVEVNPFTWFLHQVGAHSFG